MKTSTIIRLALIGVFISLSLFIYQAKAEPATDIFISEYIEGSGFNKALEFYNRTGTTIDLDAENYLVEFYNNGATSVTHSTNLTGSIANGDVFVLASDDADTNILAQADQTVDKNSWYNGNDAVVLKHNGTIIDSMGQIGNDSDWGKDQTLQRKTAVCTGDSDATDSFNPATEWDGFARQL